MKVTLTAHGYGKRLHRILAVHCSIKSPTMHGMYMYAAGYCKSLI